MALQIQEYAKLSKSELVERILFAKKELDAIILAHNYQRIEIQEIADFRGDSLDLSRRAISTDAQTIVFCGVMFMAETAKILAPQKLVLIPEPGAGCPMAACATLEDVLRMRQTHADHVFITYVNSTAEVKSVSDICCTSSNAIAVVKSVGDKPVVFLPDKNLGLWVKKQLHKENMVLWDGACYVHQLITPEHVHRAREANPEAVIIVHPECVPEVIDLADVVASTNGMFRWVAEHDRPALLGTEIGLVERIRREMPEKKVGWIKPDAICSNMKLITLSKLAFAMEHRIFEVDIEENIRAKAELAIKKMLEIC